MLLKSRSNSEFPLPSAAIFDVDGVLVDSNPYHLEKWIDFLRERKIPFNREALPRQVLGVRNDTVFRLFLGLQASAEEIERLNEELEATFRRVFRPHAKPLPGLTFLISECCQAGITMAVASCGMSKNVEFIVDELGLRPYFRYVIMGDEVVHPKPDPEIYVKAAEKLGFEPCSCVAFEDSFVGVESAKCAGMKCVAIGSSLPLDELRQETQADLVVKSFEELNLDALRSLFSANQARANASPRKLPDTIEPGR